MPKASRPTLNFYWDKLTRRKSTPIYNILVVGSGMSYLCYRDDIRGVNARRAWIVDQLGALIRNGSIPKNDQWIQSILDWLIINGLFVIRKKSDKSSYRAVCVGYLYED